MTVRLELPKDVEERLMADVKSGRHASLEEAILERLSREDDPDVIKLADLSVDEIGEDLNEAWNNRKNAVDGETVFARIAAKSAVLKSQGK
jgi:hypothetical protein